MLSLWIGVDAASRGEAAVGEDGDVVGPPVCGWASPPLFAMSSPVVDIAVCMHRCPERPITPVVSKDDQFKPTVSSKNITEDPQLFPPPTKTILLPSQTGVAVWYAAGGGLSRIQVCCVRPRSRREGVGGGLACERIESGDVALRLP